MFSKLFDYGKRSIVVLKSNPIIFITILMEMALTGLATVGFVLLVSPRSFVQYGGSTSQARPMGFMMLVLMVLAYALMEIVIQSGKLSMLCKGVRSQEVKFKDFSEGVRTFFLRLLGGNFLLMVLAALMGIVVVPIVLIMGFMGILGVILLTIGVVVIATLIIFWETILVYDEQSSSWNAIVGSIQFVKKHFWTVLLTQIIIGVTHSLLERLGATPSIQPLEIIRDQGVVFVNSLGNIAEIAMVGQIVILTALLMLFKLFIEAFYFVFYHHKGMPINNKEYDEWEDQGEEHIELNDFTRVDK